MSQFASILLLVFLLKLLAISLAAHLIKKRYADVLGSLLGGWLLCQCFLIGWMLLLSGFNSLSTIPMWMSLALLNSILLVLINREKQSLDTSLLEYKQLLSLSGCLSVFVIIVIFLFLTYRSFYFYDNTMDALTYGLTRLDFYEQAKSLFIIQPTKASNIFSNEWTGELNALFYMLTTGNEQASSFGNVEIWLLSFVIFSWLSGIVGFPVRMQYLIGLLLSTLPLLLGLSMTIKGDLLCIVSFAMAFGFTLLMLRGSKSSAFTLIFLFAALGMAGGAKIVVLPYVGLISILMGSFFIINSLGYRTPFAYTGQAIVILSISLILFCIGNSRYFLNFLAYGEWFNYIEGASFSLKNIPANIQGIIQTSPILHSWGVLEYGFGALALPLLICLFLGTGLQIYSYTIHNSLKSLENINSILEYILFFLIFCMGFSFLLVNLPWHPGAFRYFAPYLMIMALFLLAWPYRLFSLNRPHFTLNPALVCCIFSIVIMNSFCVFFSKGEAFPVDFRTAINQSEMERKIASHAYLGNPENGLQNIADGKTHHNILLFNETNGIILPFFGEKNQNTIELVSNLDVFKEKAASKQYDIAIITSSIPKGGLNIDLTGYNLANISPFWMIFKSQISKSKIKNGQSPEIARTLG